MRSAFLRAVVSASIGRRHAQHPHEPIRGPEFVVAPGSRPKFRIDPTAPPAAPPPPIAPAPAAPAPAPSETAHSPSPSKRKWLAWGAVAAVLLVAVGAYAVFGL